MTIYIVTLVVLLFFSFIELRTSPTAIQYKGMLIFVYVLFVFQAGFRWQTGTDWEPYLMHFEEVNNISDVYYSITGFERGYGLLVFLVKSIWNDYTVFLLVHAFLYYALVLSAFKKLSPYLFVSLLVFYAVNLGVLGSNRQLIALGICLYALRYVVDKKPVQFFLLIALAFSFHTTAVMFVVYYFLNRDIKKFWIFTILILSFILGKTSIPFVVFSFVGNNIGGMGATKALYYITNAQDELANKNLSVLGLLKRFLFLGLFVYNYDYLTSKLAYYKLIFNGYFVGLILYFLFSSSILVLVNRGSLYFTIMEAVLISSQFLFIKNKHYKEVLLLLLFIVTILLFFQSIAGYPDLFIPYKGIFINSDFHRYRLG